MTHASSITDDTARTIGRVSNSAFQHASVFQASACQLFVPARDSARKYRLACRRQAEERWWNATSTAGTREAELLRRRLQGAGLTSEARRAERADMPRTPPST